MKKTKRYHHRKLIKDKIPQIMDQRGADYEVRTMSKGEFKGELRRKLVEEAKEIVKANKSELLGELADVLQIFTSILEIENLRMRDVRKTMTDKKKRTGAFKKRIFLKWSSNPAGRKI